MKLQGKRVAVLADNLYQVMELWAPFFRLKEEGAEVKIVGRKKETYTSKTGYPVSVDVQADAVSAAEFDAVVVPGGWSPDGMRRSTAMVRLVREVHQQGKLVAGICHGGWLLASADILRGKRATGWFSIKDELVHAGASWVDEEVVIDGNLITARMPEDIPAFCRAIVNALAKH